MLKLISKKILLFPFLLVTFAERQLSPFGGGRGRILRVNQKKNLSIKNG